MPTSYSYDWTDMAFNSKKPIRELDAFFVAAPRDMSMKRFTEIVKAYLPKGNIVIGIAKEEYINGFDTQSQFKTLQPATIQSVIDKVNSSTSAHKIYTLQYNQRELPYILEKISFKLVVLVNGSWHRSFHTTEAYYTLVNTHTPYEHISPFTDESEARAYAEKFREQPIVMNRHAAQSAPDMMLLAQRAASHSFDTSFQTGASLGKQTAQGEYEYVTHACNTVAPYLTYAMHNGASREIHFSPPHDQNHYDAIHAETSLLLSALKNNTDISGTSLFINLLPCPSCARMLCATDIREIVYDKDHSDGYAVKLLESAGKKVTRLVG